MSRIFIFPLILFVAIPCILYKVAKIAVRSVFHPILEYQTIRLYFLVCSQLRRNKLHYNVRALNNKHYSAVMFSERNPKGNRFVYMFAVDGECLYLSKTVWADGLGEGRLKIAQFERNLIDSLKELNLQMHGDPISLPEGESQFYRIK